MARAEGAFRTRFGVAQPHGGIGVGRVKQVLGLRPQLVGESHEFLDQDHHGLR